MVLGILFQKHKFMPPFTHSQEEGKEDSADKKPGGKRDLDRQTSGDNSDKKAGGDHEHVQNNYMFQPEGIGNLKAEIYKADNNKCLVKTGGQDES